MTADGEDPAPAGEPRPESSIRKTHLARKGTGLLCHWGLPPDGNL